MAASTACSNLSDPRFLTGMGCALSIFLSAAGSAVASAHAGIYAIKRADNRYLPALVPIIVAGVLAIYGSIVSYLLMRKLEQANGDGITEIEGFRFLAAGLSVGLATLSSGWGMAIYLKQLNGQGILVAPSATSDATSGASEASPLLGSSATPPPEGDVLAALDVYGETAFTKTVLSLIYLEAIGLYGLVVALFLIGR
eukprot:CAMPEP_0201116508 /NCGR_PEP_ID=MMETSP0850-20130426/765_1 /ASSEMBLY_ACC=CAM_ASM_000622 /TAXON_ID=183588 /ORGANISM="Pseudo-nitzschia fraudulenta, Strain WWA7" /LENGTH=197 /DNA_ID=CAMNT_0047380601 /DNA_START=115 /DNA_END=708 /DNA_ORIENTATION=+